MPGARKPLCDYGFRRCMGRGSKGGEGVAWFPGRIPSKFLQRPLTDADVTLK